MNTDEQYLSLANEIIRDGVHCENRTGTDTLAVFGRQGRYDCSGGKLPVLTTKKLHTKSVITELLWFLRGDTNIRFLKAHGCRIWDEWRRPESREVRFSRQRLRPADKQPAGDYKGDFSTAGLGYLRDSEDARLASIWKNMMRRCYDRTHHNYRFYGQRGVFVDVTWHDPETFVNDVKSIPQWSMKQADWDGYQLDKDYYGAGCYSKDTCVWLRSDLNTSSTSGVVAIDPDGDEHLYGSLEQAASCLDTSASSLHRFVNQGLPKILKGKNRKFRGWRFEKAPEDEAIRPDLIVDNGDLGPVYGAQWRHWSTSGHEMELIPAWSDTTLKGLLRWYESEQPFYKMPCRASDLPESADYRYISEPEPAQTHYQVLGRFEGLKHQKVIAFNSTGSVRLVHESLLRQQDHAELLVDQFQKDDLGFYTGSRQHGLKVDNQVWQLWEQVKVDVRDNAIPISPRWKEFESFAAEISAVPGYSQWLKYGSSTHRLVCDWNGVPFYHRHQCAFIPRHIDTHRIVDETTGEVWRPRLFVDQLQGIIDRIRTTPNCRRLIVSAWNPVDNGDMALMPCHYAFQFRVLDGKLHLLFQMRSIDAFLGAPFNIMSYGLLLHVVAHLTGYEAGELIHSCGDLHLYENHMDQIKTQLRRSPYEGPTVKIDPSVKELWQLQREHIEISDYESHGVLKGKVAV